MPRLAADHAPLDRLTLGGDDPGPLTTWAPWPSRRQVADLYAGLRRVAARWRGRAASAVRPDRLALKALAELTQVSSVAREAEPVRSALVRLAAEVAGAEQAEWFREAGGSRPRRPLASWPSAEADPPAEPFGRSTLQLPLEASGSRLGTLRLTFHRGFWPSRRVIERVETLGRLAAIAERGLAGARRGDLPGPTGPADEPSLRGVSTLDAMLAFAVAQSRRRGESITLLDVSVDRIGAIRHLLGDETAEGGLDRVLRAVRSTVRTSDVVVRLENDHLSVALPNASRQNALKVAESVRAAISKVGEPSDTMPPITATIGLATFPDHARDAQALRARAAEATSSAEEFGMFNRVVEAEPVTTSPLQFHRWESH